MSRRPPQRLPGRAVWIDGRVLRGAEAVLSVFDRGARDGEGLIETVRVVAGRPFLWERHMERLVVSAAELGFPVPPSPAELRAGLGAVLEANGLGNAAARITVTRGVPGARPTRTIPWIDAEPLEARRWRDASGPGIRAILSRVPFAPGVLGRHKTTSRLAYHLAREEARALGADEALLATSAGELLEGAVSNVFVAHGDEIATPPLASGILPGIARAWVIAHAPEAGLRVVERSIACRELAGADEAFVTNAVQGVASLASIDGRPLPERARAAALRDRLEREVAAFEAAPAQASPGRHAEN